MKLSQLLAAADFNVAQIQAMPLDNERTPLLFSAMTVTIHVLRDLAATMPAHKRAHREAMRAANTIQDLALWFVTEQETDTREGNEVMDAMAQTQGVDPGVALPAIEPAFDPGIAASMPGFEHGGG
jgi:hypothetical protein